MRELIVKAKELNSSDADGMSELTREFLLIVGIEQATKLEPRQKIEERISLVTAQAKEKT